MSHKETIAAIITLVFGLGVIGAVMVLEKNKNLPAPNTAKTSSEHSQQQGDGHTPSTPDQSIGEVVDLTNQNEVTMDIKDFKYEKPNIKIKKGTKVTWTNQDAMKHNVMAEHEGSSKAHDAPKKEEVDPNELAGPLLAKGESYSFTFNEVTNSPYHCSPHPFMKGSVTVVE